MASANRYGVTAQSISAMVSNLSITDRTSPSTDAVEMMIDLYSARVHREFEVIGLDSGSLKPGDADYLFARSAVMYGVAGELLYARSRGSTAGESGDWYRQQFDDFIDQIRSRPGLVANKEVGPQMVDFVSDPAGETNAFWQSQYAKIVKGGL